MLCPVCRIDLITTDLEAFGLVVVSRCPQCRGTWFDGRQIDQLGEEVASQIAATPSCEAPGDAAPCPRCGNGALQSIAPADATRAVARRCCDCGGVWFERGDNERRSMWIDDERSHVIDRKSLESRPSNWSALRWISWRLRRCFE